MKNNELNKIKLLMSYNLGKTLTENLKMIKTLNEQTDIDEAGGEFGLARDLISATKESEKIAHLAQFFKLEEKLVVNAAVKDLDTLKKEFSKAVKEDIKNGFKGNGVLGANAKLAAKQKAINEILNSRKQLSETDIVSIIERVKQESKFEAIKIESKPLKIKPDPNAPTPPPPPPVPPSTKNRIIEFLKTRPTWQKLLAFGGISALALWYLIKDDPNKPDDTPPVPPAPTPAPPPPKPDPNPDPAPVKSKFHDCDSKPLPHEFGCRSSKIKEVQVCLKFPSKYQTGNFGPITQAQLNTNSLTDQLYNDIMSKCNSGGGSTSTGGELPKYRFDPNKIKLKSSSSFGLGNNGPVSGADVQSGSSTETSSSSSETASSSSDTQSSGEPESTLTPIQWAMSKYNELWSNGPEHTPDDNTDVRMPYMTGNARKGERVKYFGDLLAAEDLNRMDSYFNSIGYGRIKQKPKRYGEKYVWAKQ